MRFVANAAFAGTVTFQNLLDLCLVGTGATTLVNLFFAVKVRNVELWTVPTLGTAATVSLTFSGATVGASGDQKTHTDTSMGIAPAHVKARPDRLTQAGQYQPTSADVAWLMSIPSGTVVDVSLSLRNPIDGNGPISSQNPGVGVNAGQLYYRGLDGKAIATTQLPVVGVVASATI